MIGRDFSNSYFHTIYISKEESNCPLIYEIIRIGKKFSNLTTKNNIKEIIISLRYGKRILINAEAKSFGELKKEDILVLIVFEMSIQKSARNSLSYINGSQK